MDARAVTERVGELCLSRGTHRTRVSEMRTAAVRSVRQRPELPDVAQVPHRQATHHGDIAKGLDAG